MASICVSTLVYKTTSEVSTALIFEFPADTQLELVAKVP